VKHKALIFLLAFSIKVFAQQVKPLRLVAEMFDSIKNIKTLRYKIKVMERTAGGFNISGSDNKMQSNPLKIYFHNSEKKIEILYVSGVNNNKAWVKPNSFPYITVSLDPSGPIMRKNQHYTIFELGFDFAGKMIASALAKEKDLGAKNLNYYGKKEVNGFNCYMLIYENKNFTYVEYTVGQKETITSIAAKLQVSDFMLRLKNNLVNDYGYLKQGSKIMVPNYFAKRVVFYLDEKTMLPVTMTVFDDVGLFESYEFLNVVINKPIDPKEFTKEYKGYGF
jgi:hypothetical protein